MLAYSHPKKGEGNISWVAQTFAERIFLKNSNVPKLREDANEWLQLGDPSIAGRVLPPV
jgi:hypothetical protein